MSINTLATIATLSVTLYLSYKVFLSSKSEYLSYKNSNISYSISKLSAINKSASNNLIRFNKIISTISYNERLEVRTSTSYLKTVLKCKDQKLQTEKLQYGSYWLIRNFAIGSVSQVVGCADTITYTTHGDYTFLSHLPVVVTRYVEILKKRKNISQYIILFWEY